jgi:hypothetical protein
MRQQFVNRIPFLGPDMMGGLDEPALPTRRPMVFLGIQPDISPPVLIGRSRLQRMRVIIVEPPAAANLESDPLAELLPQLPAPSVVLRDLQLQPRLVHGEILQAENEELFERIGNRIHRLHQLASGPNGEVLDVAGYGLRARPSRAQVLSQLAAGNDEETQTKPKRTNNLKAIPASEAFRILFPEPGQLRVVPFGAFKQMLSSQLVHPERLRDAHRLQCHVQVYELIAPQKFDAVVAAIFGSAASSGRLQALTCDAVMQLQLGPILPAPPRVPPPAQRESGVVLPGERLFCLQLVGDPTAEDNPEPAAAAAHPPTLHPALKGSIPERFLKPWEFQLSREEALYDLSYASTFIGGLADALRRWIHWLAFRREFRKWQVLLNGKSTDEQLWSVRPPRGGLRHRFVLTWARSAIELGGYDPRNMLTEWQVFWRRKGV